MMEEVKSGNLANRLQEFIGTGRVVGALFSTFTFRREFFERTVLPLVVGENQEWRGKIPVTVVADRNIFQGHGWGYEVILPPAERTWHAKLILLLLREGEKSWTVLGIGSGNLTRSGWEANQELFQIRSIDRWYAPSAILQWLKEPWLRGSAFARGFVGQLKEEARNHQVRVISSLHQPIWEQLGFFNQGLRWSEAHVVSPFSDTGDDDLDSAGGSKKFFAHLLNRSAPGARLTVYLRGMEEDSRKALGDRRVYERLSKKIGLKLRVVPPENGRPLHGKLLALRAGGSWWVVLGSPNATAPAFTDPGGNVELAVELRRIGRFLPKDLLPGSRRISLEDLQSFSINEKRRWHCLEAARYKRGKMCLRWLEGHGFHDSRILFQKKEIRKNPVRLDLQNMEDRFLETVPRSRTDARKFEPSFVPIEMPPERADLLDPDGHEMSPDDLLRLLDEGTLEEALTDRRPDIRTPGGGRVAKEDPARFPWHEKVVTLDRQLKALGQRIEEARSAREMNATLELVERIWKRHDPKEPNLGLHERAWRRWVRGGLWHVFSSFDGRVRLWKPVRSLARRWERGVAKDLREFPIA